MGDYRKTTPRAMTDLDFVRQRRFGTLTTANRDGRPSSVPCIYAVVDHDDAPAIVIALDDKPKRVDHHRLARVRNISERPEALLLVHDTSEDWAQLAYVTVRGRAELVEPVAPNHAAAVRALRDKYPQYREHQLERSPQIWVQDLMTRGWSGGADGNYDTPHQPVPRPQDVFSVIQGRRSVRAFRSDPVPRAAIERAIAAAGWAPSPHGTQPWRFIVLESAERRQHLADAMAATWRAHLTLDGQDDATIARRLANSRDRLLTPPIVILLCRFLADLDDYPDPDRQAAEYTMATQSLGAAAQNLLLSLYADGLDAGWMCAPLFAPDVVRSALDLDHTLEPQALFPVGYPAKAPVRRPRRPLDDLIVRWE